MVFEQLDLQAALRSMDGMGFFDVALPFLLVFTIIFAILEKISLFGENKKNFSVIISLIIAFFVIRTDAVANILQLFLPKVTLAVLILTVFLIIIGIFGARPEGFKGVWLLGAVGFAIASIVWALSDAASINLPRWLQLTSADQAWLIGMAIFVLVIYFITREPRQGQNKVLGAMKKGLEDLPEQLGRKNNP